MKKIIIAGTIVVDHIMDITGYPQPKMLTNILDVNKNVGGLVPNTAYNLKMLDSQNLSVKVFGRLGNDPDGDYVITKMQSAAIDCEGIVRDDCHSTSFTEVMNDSKGERTFFHYRGANSFFEPADIDLDSLSPCHFHLGYVLLLDRFDDSVGPGKTVMSEFLKELKKRGFSTSIDLVSENSDRYLKVVLPCLRYCDYLIINETEAASLTGLDFHDYEGKVSVTAVKKMATELIKLGVRRKVIIHCPEFGMAADALGSIVTVGSLALPSEFVKGTVGAGDAFCAGCLFGILNNFDDEQILRVASAVAANSLKAVDSTSAADTIGNILGMEKVFGRKTVNEEK